MKNFVRFLMMGILILTVAFGTTSCKKDKKETTITGTASFPAGTSGDLSNSKVSIYLTYDDWYNNSPVKFVPVSGAGSTVSFDFGDVAPGNYYLDVWKDIDNSGSWSAGDYVGWYGSGGLGAPQLTPFQLLQDQNFSCSINMYVIGKSTNPKGQ